MKINDEIIVEIIDTGINGEGIAKSEEYVIFVPFTLKNETVKIKIETIKNNLVFSSLIDVITPSSNRVQPPCPYFYKCGGCSLQHTSYENQLLIKQNNVKNTLLKLLKNIDILPCIPSDFNFNYRNKIEFYVDKTKIGFFEKNSHKIIEINKCLLFPESENILIILKKYLQNINNININHIIIRYIQNSLAIVFIGNITKLINLDFLINLLKEKYKLFSIFISFNNTKFGEIIKNKIKLIYGDEEQTIKEDFLSCNISPNSFLQINENIKNKLYKKALEYIKKDSVVINAFSGAGLLSAIFAQKAKTVYGIEINKSANFNANELAKNNKLNNLINICGDCTSEIPKLLNTIIEKNINLVLDPAKKGVEKSALEIINKSDIENIIYISCNPATLARDLSYLTNFEVKLVQPFDMFPNASNIETLVVLDKKNK